MLKIAKYLLTAVLAVLFGAVVVGYSLYFENINNKINSSKTMRTILMNNAESGSSESGIENIDTNIAKEMASEDAVDDEEDYRNPALDYVGAGGDTSRINPALGINEALNIGKRNTGNIALGLNSENQQSITSGATGQGGMQGDPSEILRNKFAAKESAGSEVPEELEKLEEPVSEQPEIKQKAEYSGYYKLQIALQGGSVYNANVQIEEQDNAVLKITGKYAYVNFSLTGIPVKTTTDTGLWAIKADTNRLFKGSAAINITRENESYQLEGQGSGSYNLLLSKGKNTARIIGIKESRTAPTVTEPTVLDNLNTAMAFVAPEKGFNQPSPFSAGSASAIAALAAIVAGTTASRRKHKENEKIPEKARVAHAPEFMKNTGALSVSDAEVDEKSGDNETGILGDGAQQSETVQINGGDKKETPSSEHRVDGQLEEHNKD